MPKSFAEPLPSSSRLCIDPIILLLEAYLTNCPLPIQLLLSLSHSSPLSLSLFILLGEGDAIDQIGMLAMQTVEKVSAIISKTEADKGPEKGTGTEKGKELRAA